MGSTHTKAWILTFLRNTSQVAWTFGTDNAFGFTFYVWVPNVVINTFTCCSLTLLETLGIDSAGRGVARSDDLNWSLCCDLIAVNEWVAYKSLVTHTHGYMVADSAVCVVTT